MEFTYSLTQEQMKTGLRYYLLWRFFGLRVAYSLLAVLLAAGSCAYGIWSSHSPFFAAAGFLLLTVVLLWLMPFTVQGDVSLPEEETVRFLSRGIKLNGKARLISYRRYIKFALEKKGAADFRGKAIHPDCHSLFRFGAAVGGDPAAVKSQWSPLSLAQGNFFPDRR